MSPVPRLLAAAVITLVPLAGTAAPATAATPPPAQTTSGRAGTTALAVPADLVATNDAAAIRLSWRQPRTGATATSFRVYEGTTVVARTTTTSAVLRNLGFGTHHTYTVTAVDSQGRESGHSAPVSRSVWVGGQPPSCWPPRFPVPVATEVTPSAISVTWQPGDEPRLYRFQVESPALPAPLVLPSVGTGARIGGLAPATTYTFRVLFGSCNGSQIPPLTVLTVTTPAGPAARPSAPVGLAVTATTATSATLRWAAPADGPRPARYAVYEGATLIALTDSPSYTVRRLFHAERYGFTVASLDAAGNESAHTPLVVAATAVCPYPAPKPIQVRAEALSSSTVRLSWVQLSAADSFTVFDSAAGAAPVATTTAPAAVLSGLASNSGHSYRVVATLTNGCGDTAASSSASVRTPAGPTARPSAPTGVSARVAAQNGNTDAVVAVTWSPSAGGATAYRVYEDATVVATSTGTSAQVRVLTNTTHTYTVTAVDAAGNESPAGGPAHVRVPYFPLP